MSVNNNFKRLRSCFFSLYEIEQELSLIDKSITDVVGEDEYSYISSVQLRKEELIIKIEELLDGSKNKETE